MAVSLYQAHRWILPSGACAARGLSLTLVRGRRDARDFLPRSREAVTQAPPFPVLTRRIP